MNVFDYKCTFWHLYCLYDSLMTGVPSEVPGKYNMDATANARSSIGKAITDH